MFEGLGSSEQAGEFGLRQEPREFAAWTRCRGLGGVLGPCGSFLPMPSVFSGREQVKVKSKSEDGEEVLEGLGERRKGGIV